MSKTFQRLLVIVTLSFGSLFSNEPKGWNFTTDFLYLKPSLDATYFVIKDPGDGFFPNGTRENNDFEYEPAFRVGVGYISCLCNKGFQVNYTRLTAKQGKVIESGDGFLWATQGRADFINFFDPYEGTASADLDLLYQRADANFVQKNLNYFGLLVDFQAGLEYAYFHLKENYLYHRTNIIEFTGQVNHRSKSYGIGPQLGLSLEYPLYQCCETPERKLCLSFLSSASLLISKSNVSVKNSTTIMVAPLDVTDEGTWRLIPALHARLGLTFTTPIRCIVASLGIGYEFHSYIRAYKKGIFFPDQITDGLSFTNFYNFDLHGLFVSATIQF